MCVRTTGNRGCGAMKEWDVPVLGHCRLNHRGRCLSFLGVARTSRDARSITNRNWLELRLVAPESRRLSHRGRRLESLVQHGR